MASSGPNATALRDTAYCVMSDTTNTSRGDNPDDAARIEALLGADVLAYLRKKHTGGTSGAKGVRYEDVFAAVQVADVARSRGSSCNDVSLESQVALAFLDDLKIVDRAAPHRRYFQLKNTAGIAWSSGLGSLFSDCAQQARLCDLSSEGGVELVIVTSDQGAAQRLAHTMPAELRAFTRVIWFPWEASIPLLCKRWESELSALAWLSKHAEPSFHDIVEVLGILCGTWMRYTEPVTALEVITAARSSSPTLIRPLVSDDEAALALGGDFTAALASIENFSYSIVKGFFSWEVRHPNGTMDAGVLSHDCLSEQFQALQSRVVRLAPLTFESMEDQLV